MKDNMKKTHGMWNTRFYKIWCSIKSRCNRVEDPRFFRYGGRGIKVCDEWLDFIAFKTDMYDSYLEHIKLYGAKNTTIERINNDKGYTVKNCKWATQKEQANNRGNNYLITYQGETKTLSEWAKYLKIARATLNNRLHYYKWSIKKAFSTAPSQRINRKDNRFIVYNGKKQTLSQWADELNISMKTLKTRYYRGWDLKKVFDTPVRVFEGRNSY